MKEDIEKGEGKAVKKQSSPAGFVKKETLLLVGLLCLIAGFLSGIAFSVYKAPAVEHQHESGAQEKRLSAEQSQSILKFESAVESNPQSIEAWTSLGHLYFDTDQPEKAINAYTKSLALSPANPDVLTDLGVMYRRVGRPDQAIASFDKAIGINGRHEIARFNKGVVLFFDIKDKDGGLAAWRELVAINPMATAPNGQMVSEIIKEVQR